MQLNPVFTIFNRSNSKSRTHRRKKKNSKKKNYEQKFRSEWTAEFPWAVASKQGETHVARLLYHHLELNVSCLRIKIKLEFHTNLSIHSITFFFFSYFSSSSSGAMSSPSLLHCALLGALPPTFHLKPSAILRILLHQKYIPTWC